MDIRELREGDIADLSDLAAKTFIETFGDSLTPEELDMQLKETRSQEYFKNVLEEDNILVAVKGKDLHGYIQLSDVNLEVRGEVQPKKGDQSVHAIYVHSDYQGQGVGRALMDAAFDHPRFKTANNIFIDVWGENKRALNFYLQYGFTIVGTCDVVVDKKVIGFDLVLVRPM